MERPLFWHQGLFLQPQHFQLKDLYDQSLLTPLHRFLHPHFWGISEMDIQQTSLGNYSFNLLRGEFLFSDMTYVVLDEKRGNAKIQPRSFEEAWKEREKDFPVYLGIRKWNDGGENVTVLSDLKNIAGVTTRFVTTTDTEEVHDLHQNGPSAHVKKMYHVLHLFWKTEEDLLGDYDLIQIAKLKKDGDEIKLSERFIPPCINITGSHVLDRLIRDIRDQTASRARRFEAYKQKRGIDRAESGARDMNYLLKLILLNRYVPILTHLTETQRIHPWSVYSVLRQLIGELSSFSEYISVSGEREDAQVLFGYDHRNLWKCFSGARTLVTQLLELLDPEPEYIYQLMYDGTYFATDLQPKIFEGRNRFFLVLETDADLQSTLQDIDRSAKLGSREDLPILIARALPGIKLKHLPIPPQELPRLTDAIFFQIDHHSDYWTQVQRENNLALYWDKAPQDLKVALMIVERT